MTTALDTIKRALRMLGVYPSGEELSADESADALTTLNALVGTLSNTGLVYAKTLDTISIAGGTQSINVGPSGGIITARPVQVLPASYLTVGTASYPLLLLTLQQYNSIGLKTITGIPEAIWVQPDMPNVTVTFWPVPDQAMTLKLWSSKVLASTLSLTTELSLPPGGDDMLAYLLADAIAPEYEVEPSPSVMRGVKRARKLLKRTSLQVPKLSMPQEVLSGRGFMDIQQF